MGLAQYHEKRKGSTFAPDKFSLVDLRLIEAHCDDVGVSLIFSELYNVFQPSIILLRMIENVLELLYPTLSSYQVRKKCLHRAGRPFSTTKV